MSGLVIIKHETVVPVDNPPFFPEILEGKPRTRAWRFSTALDGRAAAGIWESTPGVWRMDYNGIWEFCSIIEGSCVITPDGGVPVTLSAGDTFICEPGLSGTWRVITTMQKYFTVIHPER